MTIDEQEEIRRGELIVQALMMRLDQDNRVKTTWGTKTPLGLFRMLKRIVEEGK